jgi:hypothetical protein
MYFKVSRISESRANVNHAVGAGVTGARGGHRRVAWSVGGCAGRLAQSMQFE